MGTYIVGALVLAAVFFAARHVLKVTKSGGCVGCGESSGCKEGCCHCAASAPKSKGS